MRKVSATVRWTLIAVLGLVIALALALVLPRWQGSNSGQTSDQLVISAGETELVFSAPLAGGAWSATAGSFLFCSSVDRLKIREIVPISESGVQDFRSFIRVFKIGKRDFSSVEEPIIGAYGVPPLIGGVDNPRQSRLVGTLITAEGATIILPRCDESTGAPGDPAVELLLVVTGGSTGASVNGVAVRYELNGEQHEVRISVAVTLCGTEFRDPDC